jgi:predicted nucleic acid-binding protein
LVVTDDLKPRKVAKVLKLDVIGTLGILRLAYRRDLIDKAELKEYVKKLHDVLYFKEDLEKWVLR